ncbi:MAG: trigger factor [Capnocytophaga sp.]|nr:trigger factor [Capnocytophaga sp.]
MNITKEQNDALNAVLTVAIAKDDYAPKVAETLNNYRKTANVPGFRKGHVPAGLIQKQYGKAVLVDEVNKLLQEALNKYITEEKLDILGNPLPKENENFDWNADDFAFEFEIGLAPEFTVDLQPKNGITYYDIQVDDASIDRQIERIRKQFGKLVAKGEIADQDDFEITGSFFNEEKNIDNQATFTVEKLTKKARKAFVGKKIGDQFGVQTKGLFQDAHDLMHYLKVSHDDAHDLDVEVTFTLEEANTREQAELNQELFDRLFPEGTVTSEGGLREEIKKNSALQYTQQADQHFLNAVTEYLVDNTKFDLPAEFLTKWLRVAGEKELTAEEAAEEYEKSEKGLRYQLIEGKLVTDNNLQISFEELKNFAKENIRQQMLQYGMPADDDSYVNDIVNRILSNRDEVTRMNQQLTANKLIAFYKENVKRSEKKVTFDEFVKEAYGENA